jgi:Arc/MetJ family transcription regulator
MRTNIIIDDRLMEEAMRLSGLSTKKEVVNQALAEFVQRRNRKDLRELQGKIRLADGYDYRAHREGRSHGAG